LEREIDKDDTITAPSPSSLARMMEMLSTYHFRFEYNDNSVKKFISVNNPWLFLSSGCVVCVCLYIYKSSLSDAANAAKVAKVV